MVKDTDNIPAPTVLDLLRQTPSGDIYLLADKESVGEGFSICDRPVIDSISILEEGRELVVKLSELSTVTISCRSRELVVTGDGPRRSARVVAVMAILKRLVTPGCLSHVRFDRRHLAEVAIMIGLPAPEAPASSSSGHDVNREKFSRHTTIAPKPIHPGTLKRFIAPRSYRLVLFEQAGTVNGQVRFGETPLYPGMPASRDLAGFLTQHYFFRASHQYFHDFTHLPGKDKSSGRHNGVRVVL